MQVRNPDLYLVSHLAHKQHQLLWYSQPSLGRQMPRLQQMVLQFPREHVGLAYCQPSRAR